LLFFLNYINFGTKISWYVNLIIKKLVKHHNSPIFTFEMFQNTNSLNQILENGM